MFFVDYVRWHYGQALVLYIRTSKNFWWFFVQFFSLTALLSSFFAPYKRITEDRPRGFDIEGWISALIINVLSRIIRMGIRLVLIVTGLLTLVLYTVTIFIGYGVWLIAPIVILTCIGYGTVLLV